MKLNVCTHANEFAVAFSIQPPEQQPWKAISRKPCISFRSKYLREKRSISFPFFSFICARNYHCYYCYYFSVTTFLAHTSRTRAQRWLRVVGSSDEFAIVRLTCPWTVVVETRWGFEQLTSAGEWMLVVSACSLLSIRAEHRRRAIHSRPRTHTLCSDCGIEARKNRQPNEISYDFPTDARRAFYNEKNHDATMRAQSVYAFRRFFFFSCSLLLLLFCQLESLPSIDSST